MIGFETDYFEIVEEIMTYGTPTSNTSGSFNISSVQMQINLLNEGFPLIKTHGLNINEIIVDTLGNVKGINNNKWFRAHGCPRYTRYGIAYNATKQIPKEDHELVDEYCSNKGEYRSTAPEYLSRYAELKSLSVNEGYALMDQHDIPFYKDVVLKERGNLGVTRGVLWRKYPGAGNKKIDQLQNAFDHLKSNERNKAFNVYSYCPSLAPDSTLNIAENIAAGNMGGLTSHISHQYYTFPISALDRVEWYNKNFKNNIKIDSTNLFEVNKKLDAYHVPKYYLDINIQQANWDFIKDAPLDIAGYGVLLTMMAKSLNMVPRIISVNATNVFIYKVYLDAITEMFNRISKYDISKDCCYLDLTLRKEVTFIDQFTLQDFTLTEYNPFPAIKMPGIKII